MTRLDELYQVIKLLEKAESTYDGKPTDLFYGITHIARKYVWEQIDKVRR